MAGWVRVGGSNRYLGPNVGSNKFYGSSLKFPIQKCGSYFSFSGRGRGLDVPDLPSTFCSSHGHPMLSYFLSGGLLPSQHHHKQTPPHHSRVDYLAAAKCPHHIHPLLGTLFSSQLLVPAWPTQTFFLTRHTEYLLKIWLPCPKSQFTIITCFHFL